MRALIVKTTGQVLGIWPSAQKAEMSGFSKTLHEWDENAPDDLIVDDVSLYTRTGGVYIKSARADEREELKSEILAELDTVVDAKILAGKSIE